MSSCSNSLIALIICVQQDLAEAGDEAHRKYVEESKDGNRTKSGMRATISSAMDSKHQKLNAPFTKHLSICKSAEWIQVPNGGTSNPCSELS